MTIAVVHHNIWILLQDCIVSNRPWVADTTLAAQRKSVRTWVVDMQGHGDARGPMVSRQSSASSSVPERGALRRTTEDSEAGGGGGSSNASWDIFEPRAGADANGASTMPRSGPPSGAVTDLSALKQMTGAPPACAVLSGWARQ